MGELIGYARCSTVLQDLTAQRQALSELGVPDDRIYLDKGLTGTSRARPGLDQALAAVRSGDTLVVPKLDRLARYFPAVPRWCWSCAGSERSTSSSVPSGSRVTEAYHVGSSSARWHGPLVVYRHSQASVSQCYVW